MAIAVIVGILFATVLTLIVVPVMYSLVDDFTDLLRRYFVAGTEPAAAGRQAETRAVESATGPPPSVPAAVGA